MDQSANLDLPLLMPSQAQKHITHNEALLRLDAIVQLAVLARHLTTPPGSPADGDRYVVAAGATGAWDGWDNSIASRAAGAWTRLEPRAGWLCWVDNEDALLLWDGSAWTPAAATIEELQELHLLGVGTTADVTNPFAAKLNSALWSAKYASEGGDGDLRFKFNKETAGDTASILMQRSHSGRGEIGLVGNDDLTVKVSPDGSTWRDALIAEKDTGLVRLPYGLKHAATGHAMRSLVFTPGGDGVVSVWRSNTARTDNPRTAAISSVSGDTITISTAEAQKFGLFTGFMANCAYVRIWNASKTPEQSAWVKATPTTTTLQVLTAADIATWTNGEAIRIGDPTTIAPVASFAIDISPMLQNVLGAVFRQSGVLAKLVVNGSAATTLSISEAAVSGSLQPVKSFADGSQQTHQFVIPCSVLSPISNSNLIFIREQGSVTTAAISIMGVYV